MPSPIRSFWVDFKDRFLSSSESPFSTSFPVNAFISSRLSPTDRGGICNTPTGIQYNGSIGGIPESTAEECYSIHYFRGEDQEGVFILATSNPTKPIQLTRVAPFDSPTAEPQYTESSWAGANANIGDGGGVDIVPFGDYLYIFRGYGSPTNGKIAITPTLAQTPTVGAIGVDRPDISDVAVTSTTGGDLNVKGVVKYFISQMVGGVESALSTYHSSTGLDCGDGKRGRLAFNATAFPAYASNTYRIYRTPADFHQPLYVGVVDVAASGTTVFLDDILDADLGDPPYQHGDPPPSDIHTAIRAYGRIWGCNKTHLYWSDPLYPESWWTTEFGNNLLIVDGVTDKICKIDRDEISFVIFTESTTYRLYGATPDQFYLSPINSDRGTSEGLGIFDSSMNLGVANAVHTDHGICFRSPRGIFLLKGNSLYELTKELRETIYSGEYGQRPGIGYDPKLDELWCSFYMPDTYGTNEYQTLIYNFQLSQWIGHSEVPYSCFVTYDGTLSGVIDNAGVDQVLSIRNLTYLGVTGDPESAFGWGVGEVRFGRFFAANPFSTKRFMSVSFSFDTQDSVDFEVDFIIDGNEAGKLTYQILDTSSSPIRFPLGKMGRDIEVRIRQVNGPVNWTLYGLGYEFQYLGDSKKFGSGVGVRYPGKGGSVIVPFPTF